MRAVPNRIEHVLSLRAPSQVFRAVVPSVAVEMPNDEAATSGPAVEGESHKHVDERTATSRELDAEVTVMVQRAGQPATLGIQDGASARGHVASESRDGPALTHDFLGSRPTPAPSTPRRDTTRTEGTRTTGRAPSRTAWGRDLPRTRCTCRTSRRSSGVYRPNAPAVPLVSPRRGAS